MLSLPVNCNHSQLFSIVLNCSFSASASEFSQDSDSAMPFGKSDSPMPWGKCIYSELKCRFVTTFHSLEAAFITHVQGM